jgi:hypothetical protein
MFLALQALHDWFVLRVFLWAAARAGWGSIALYCPGGEDAAPKAWILADSIETVEALLENADRKQED